MKLSNKLILVILATALIAGGLWLSYYLKRLERPIYDTFSATRGTVIQEVVVAGKIKPAKKIGLEFKNQGQISKISVIIGDDVKEGQELARLDLKELNIQKRDVEISLAIVKTNLEKLLAGFREEEIAIAQTKTDSSKTALNDAQIYLENIKDDYGQKTANIYADGQNTVFSAYYYANSARDTLYTLFENDSVKSMFNTVSTQSQTNLEAQKTRIDASFIESQKSQDDLKVEFSGTKLATAQNNLFILLGNLKDGLGYAYDVLNGSSVSPQLSQAVLDSYKSNISTALLNVVTSLSNIVVDQNAVSQAEIAEKLAVDAAQEKLNAAQSAYDLAQDELVLKKAPPTDQDIKLAQANMDKAQATLDLIKEKIRNSIIYAPIKGTVIALEYGVGESVRPGMPVVLMINSYDLDIEANIPEFDIVKVRVNDLAFITLEAFGQNKSWNGKVAMIDPAELEVRGGIYYKTTIVFEDNDEGIKPGMTANIKIKTAAAENVILIPQRALAKNDQGENTVKIMDERGNIQEKKIEIGLKGSDGFVEIISGVAEKDRVVTSTKIK